ncbi:MAG TPA: pilin [Candidatus Saccharimonadales bacterium]|nr:pilin [Candidatus Saccharimonadales bacterium]
MIQKLKNKLLLLAAVLMFAIPLSAPALADCSSAGSGGSDCIQGGLCSGAQSLSVTPGTSQCTEQQAGLQGTVTTVVNILSVVVGIVAVIMIIVAGFRYVTSGGKQESVTGAKNTILYAVIGLVVVALAQVIVRFVLTRTTSG